MTELRFNDGVISYNVHGDGAPLVILRGLGRSVSHWLGYEKELGRHHRVITIDLRGVGKTTRPWTITTSIYDIAGDVVAVLDDLKIERAHILGVSLGGMVTLATGIRHPDRCASLITVNTSIAGMRTLRLTPSAIKFMLSTVKMPHAMVQTALVDMLVGNTCPADRRSEVVKAFSDIAKSEGMYTPTVVRQLVSALRFLPIRQLRLMQVPTLIIYGTHDRFVPNKNSRRLAQYIPHATLQPVDGGGHELTLDKGPEIARVVDAWIAGQKLPA